MRRALRGVVTLVVFALAERASRILGLVPLYAALRASWFYAASALASAVETALCFVALRVQHGLRWLDASRELGLGRSPRRGLCFALGVTAPMLVAFAATSPVNPELTALGVVFGAGVQPLAEEILYRGYAFRQLHARAGWGFWPAALAVAAVFGLGHLYQVVTGNLSLAGAFGVFAITAFGSVFFSWLFVRWRYDLWVPFGVHALMNLWWELFAIDETALGGWLANAARAATLLVAIGATLRFAPAAGVDGSSAEPERPTPPRHALRSALA